MSAGRDSRGHRAGRQNVHGWQAAGGGKEIQVTQELIDLARAEGWRGGDLMATAAQLSMPTARNIEITCPPNGDADDPMVRGGYIGRPVTHWRELDRVALGYGTDG